MKDKLKDKYSKTVLISTIVLTASGPLFTLVSMFFFLFSNISFFDINFTESKLLGTILFGILFVIETLFVIPGYTSVLNGKLIRAAKIVGCIRGIAVLLSVCVLLFALFNKQSLNSGYSIKYFVSLFGCIFYTYGIIMYKPESVNIQ